MEIGDRIREIRLEKGLTQKQVAEKAGMADSAIRKYESGKQHPKIETLQRISMALGVDLFALINNDIYNSTVKKEDLGEQKAKILHGVGTRIKNKRLSKNLSLRELAAQINLSEQELSGIERGILYPDYALIGRIAKVLDVNPTEFLFDPMPTHKEINYTIDCVAKAVMPADKIWIGNQADNISNLLGAFALLNATGQQKAIERIEELTKVPEYKTK